MDIGKGTVSKINLLRHKKFLPPTFTQSLAPNFRQINLLQKDKRIILAALHEGKSRKPYQ